MTDPIRLLSDYSQHMITWAESVRSNSRTDYAAARELVMRLGTHYSDGITEIGFWVPELRDHQIPDEHIFLECLTPNTPIDLQAQT